MNHKILYRVVFPDGDYLQSEEGVSEFRKDAADYFASRIIEYTYVKVQPYERFCRFHKSYHLYEQDGCEHWPAVTSQTIINLGIGHRGKMLCLIWTR